MTTSIAIMADERRAAWVADMQAQVRPDHVAWSRGDGPIPTGRRAWESYDPAADWHVVLQDDAVPCAHFRERAAHLLDGLDQIGPVSFYLGTGRPRQRQVLDAIKDAPDPGGLIELPWLLWGVAIALPTSHIDAMLLESEASTLPYDLRISSVYERRGIPTRYTWPSLVDHRDDGSLVHKQVSVPRRAYWFIDRATVPT